MSNQVATYKKIEGELIIGKPAFVECVEHTHQRLNGKYGLTSPVESISEHGFKTKNTYWKKDNAKKD